MAAWGRGVLALLWSASLVGSAASLLDVSLCKVLWEGSCVLIEWVSLTVRGDVSELPQRELQGRLRYFAVFGVAGKLQGKFHYPAGVLGCLILLGCGLQGRLKLPGRPREVAG